MHRAATTPQAVTVFRRRDELEDDAVDRRRVSVTDERSENDSSSRRTSLHTQRLPCDRCATRFDWDWRREAPAPVLHGPSFRRSSSERNGESSIALPRPPLEKSGGLDSVRNEPSHESRTVIDSRKPILFGDTLFRYIVVLAGTLAEKTGGEAPPAGSTPPPSRRATVCSVRECLSVPLPVFPVPYRTGDRQCSWRYPTRTTGAAAGCFRFACRDP